MNAPTLGAIAAVAALVLTHPNIVSGENLAPDTVTAQTAAMESPSGEGAASKGASVPGMAVHCARDRVYLRAPDGRIIEIAVEIADTDQARAQGLMFRQAVAPGSGMLFVYDQPQPVAFWMRNTLVPLDMLFIDTAGEVRLVHANAIPHDETAIPGALPGDPAPERLMVLEVGGGEAARLGLVEGTVLASPLLDQGLAAWPCK